MIRTKDFIITERYVKYQKKVDRVYVTTYDRKTYSFNLRKPERTGTEFDANFVTNKKKMNSASGPNVIHSMDASVPHDMSRKELAIKKELGKIDFNIYTNHDCFAIGSIGLAYIPYLVRDCYINLYNYGFLHTIKENYSAEDFAKLESLVYPEGHPNHLSGDLDNPYFLKNG
jgi:DNA-directed RNA polymerase